MEGKAEDGAAENDVEDESQDVKKVLPVEQAGFLEGLGLQHISKVSLEMYCTSNQVRGWKEKKMFFKTIIAAAKT